MSTIARMLGSTVGAVGAVAMTVGSAAPAGAQERVVFTKVSVGFGFTCAVTSSGGARCWGYNHFGQLGDGTTTDRAAPVTVSGLTSGVRSVQVGNTTACALMTAGDVKCWGMGLHGEMGTGSLVDQSLTPVPVRGLSDVVWLRNYEATACAVTRAGAAYCWGSNNSGKLGNGSTVNSAVPVPVSGLSSGVKMIDVGSTHSCAVLIGGAVKCWGNNTYGQLGSGKFGSPLKPELTPVPVKGLAAGAPAVKTGRRHTCAQTASGRVKCWGFNMWGELGIGSAVNKPYPVWTVGIEGSTTNLTAGDEYTCATVAGAAKCWGNNDYGGLGDGTTTTRAVPTQVVGLTRDVLSVDNGESHHTCAVLTSGRINCWGMNDHGQLGDGTTTDSLVPVEVAG